MKNSLRQKINQNKYFLILPLIAIGASIFFTGFQIRSIFQENSALSSIMFDMQQKTELSEKNLADERVRNTNLQIELQNQKASITFLSEQMQEITGTVGILEKLRRTDPELLRKYSKVYFLNENYLPQQLVQIDSKYLYLTDKPLHIHINVWPFLQRLLDAATSENIDLKIISAYRSFGTQASLKSTYTVIYGAGTANKFSADQGYSEHQLGSTLDFTTQKLGTNFVEFEKSEAYNWLKNNAHKYGFVLSYPKDNDYYAYEPWHWRFVGVTLATKLHDEGKYFYDLDQRVIDQYLVNLFD